jgi:hypothetical protein
VLQALLDGAFDSLRYSDHFDVPGADFFMSACKLGVEGMISKRATGTFQSGRSSGWLKVKCVRRTDRFRIDVRHRCEPDFVHGSQVGHDLGRLAPAQLRILLGRQRDAGQPMGDLARALLTERGT